MQKGLIDNEDDTFPVEQSVIGVEGDGYGELRKTQPYETKLNLTSKLRTLFLINIDDMDRSRLSELNQSNADGFASPMT